MNIYILQRFDLLVKSTIVMKKSLVSIAALYTLFLFTQFSPAQAQIIFSTKTDFTTGTSPYSIATGDLNRDGKLDLAVANFNSNTVSVFLNTTTTGALTPSFSAKTDFTTGIYPLLVTYPASVVIGELNGNNKPDMAVTNWNINTEAVFLNTTTPGAATPSFSSKTDFSTGSGSGPNFSAIGDLNLDNKLDLAVSNYNSKSVSVFLNITVPDASIPSFASRIDFSTGNNISSVAIGDLNGDGNPDLAATNYLYNTVSVFLNTTAAGVLVPSFSAPIDFATGVSPRTVAIGDLNGDSKPDLAVANENSNTISVLLNTTTPGASTPSFSDASNLTTGNNPFTVAISDLNFDDNSDLLVTNLNSNTVSVFSNTTTPGASTPSFSAQSDLITGSNPRGLAISDLNGDGKSDVTVTNQNSSTISVFLNTSILQLTIMSMNQGWNLISVPRVQLNDSTKRVFPGITGSMYKYNTATKNYQSVLTLVNGSGYWANFSSSTIVTINGSAPGSLSVAVDQAGWALVGSRDTQINLSSLIFSNGAMRLGSAYWYDAFAKIYKSTTIIHPGEAVWLNVSKACTITIP